MKNKTAVGGGNFAKGFENSKFEDVMKAEAIEERRKAIGLVEDTNEKT